MRLETHIYHVSLRSVTQNTSGISMQHSSAQVASTYLARRHWDVSKTHDSRVVLV